MNREQIIAWAAGLFEGEGSFNFHKNKAKHISITSTDLDVLERMYNFFGGNIYKTKKYKEHYKQAYVWCLRKSDAINFYNDIKPFLLKRRCEKGDIWIYEESIKQNNNPHPNESKIIDMFKKGKTHSEISKELNLERSSISKFLNRRGLYKIKNKNNIEVFKN